MSDPLQLLDIDLEDRLLRSMLAYERLIPLVKQQLSSEHFSTPIKGLIYRNLVEYWTQFQERATPDNLIFFMQGRCPQEQISLATSVLINIGKIDAPSWSSIVARAEWLVHSLKIHKGLFEAAERLKEGNLDGAKSVLVNSIQSAQLSTTGTKSDLELDYHEIHDIVREEDILCCKTLIQGLDECIHGLNRKELLVVLAPLNVGKSWAVVHFAGAALLHGKRVLYLTLEMSRQRVLQRMFQWATGASRVQNQEQVSQYVDIWLPGYMERSRIQVPTIGQIGEVKKSLDILNKRGGSMSVVEYPSGSATISDVERQVSEFDVKFGGPPDLILVDGLMDMKVAGDPSNLRHSLTASIRDLRRIASENSAAVVVTHQANREAMKADTVRAEHSGEALSVMQVADTAISLNQSRADNQEGKLKIHVVRARNQQKWQVITVWQNLNLGQFSQWSEVVKYKKKDENKKSN